LDDNQNLHSFEQPRADEIDYDALEAAEVDTDDWFADDSEPEAEKELKVEEPEIRRRLTGFLKTKPTLASFCSADLSAEAERATRMAASSLPR
jgi:hypothetical protein